MRPNLCSERILAMADVLSRRQGCAIARHNRGMKINLRDLGFAHHTISPYATLYGTSNIMEWDRTCSQPGPTVYTDAFLSDGHYQFEGDKIAWLMEPLPSTRALTLD